MEDVLAVYTRPYDPARPLVSLDETSMRLSFESRPPIPTRPGREARFDYEYEGERVWPAYLCCLPRWKAGAMSRFQSAALPSTLPTSSRISPIPTSPRLTGLHWFRTISTPTTRRRYKRPFRPMKPGALPNGLNGTLRPNTAPGSTSQNVNSAHLRVNVSTGAFQIAIPWSLKQRHGKPNEKPHLQR